MNIDLAKQNKLVSILIGAEMLVLDIAYFVEMLKRNRTWGFIAFMIVMTIICIVGNSVILKRKADSSTMKWFTCGCFLLFYAVLLFLSQTPLDFVYGIPFLLVVIAYADIRFNIIFDVSVFVLIVSYLVYKVAAKKVAAEDMTTFIQEAEISVALILVFAVFASFIANLFNKSAARKISEVDASRMEIMEQSDKIKETVANLSAGISEVSELMDKLTLNTSKAKNSMDEVNKGISECANTMTNQIKQTTEIQDRIDFVTDSTDSISGNVNNTAGLVKQNNEMVKKLAEGGLEAARVGETVSGSLATLSKQAESMGDIIEIISKISSKTNLLALNASIEAARAGEAGRGFSVVATEISNLSKQTNDATKNISELLDTINAQVNVVIEATNTLLENNRSEIEGITRTSETFETITGSTVEIDNSTRELKKAVIALNEANKAIVESTTSVSALSQEVNAEADEINEYMNDNLAMVSDVLAHVEELDALSKSLI